MAHGSSERTLTLGREGIVRMVFDRQEQDDSQWVAIATVATITGWTAWPLRMSVGQVEQEAG